MPIIAYDANRCQNVSPTLLLNQLDLCDWEAAHHWDQFEALTLEAQRHLTLYDAVCCRRKELMRAVSGVLAAAPVAVRP